MRPSCLFAAAFLLAAPGAQAELYKWTDAQGKVHFTDDATQVPADQRATSRQDPDSRSGSRNYNIVDLKPRTSGGRWTQAPASPGKSARNGKTHVIGFARGASEINLKVTLDGQVEAPFIADTGASMNTMPRWVADRLDIEISNETPHIQVVGVGGRPITAPVVRLESIRVGSAEVRNVDVVVLDTINEGLLGLPFFNHFKVELDPSAGRMKLTEIDMRASGLEEANWRQRYRKIRNRFDALADARENVPPEFETVNEAYTRRLDEQEAALEEALERLDEDATRAGVPGHWRE